MQEDDLKTIKVTIAGRTFPVKVDDQEETVVKDLEQELNNKVLELQNMYPGRDKLDCVIMTLLTYTFDQKKSGVTADQDILGTIEEISATLSDIDYTA